MREVVVGIFQVLTFAVLARALMSWFPASPDNPLVRILWKVTEPILAPLRAIIPRIGMIDITPMVAIILLQVIGGVLAKGL
jgi:YggT family protein